MITSQQQLCKENIVAYISILNYNVIVDFYAANKTKSLSLFNAPKCFDISSFSAFSSSFSGDYSVHGMSQWMKDRLIESFDSHSRFSRFVL